MLFHLRLLLKVFGRRKSLLLIACLPPLAYLAIAATRPTFYEMVQQVAMSSETLVSVGQNPSDVVPIETYVRDQPAFFSDNLMLMNLREYLLTENSLTRPEWAEWLPSRFATFLKRAVTQDMSLAAPGGDLVEVRYAGPDLQLGTMLVDFYAQRLVWGVRRAIERSIPTAGVQTVNHAPTLGDLRVTKRYEWINAGRLYLAVAVAALSLVALFVVLGSIYFLKPRLVTERQAARYLDIDILGAIPDLNRLQKMLGDRSGEGSATS